MRRRENAGQEETIDLWLCRSETHAGRERERERERECLTTLSSEL